MSKKILFWQVPVVWYYTGVGFLLGLMLPIFAMFMETLARRMPLAWDSMTYLQIHCPSLWIVNTAPLVMALTFHLVGIREQQLLHLTARQEEIIAARTAELTQLNAQLTQENQERRQMEEEVKNERDFAMRVMLTMGQGLVVTDDKGLFTFANPAFARLVGETSDSLQGRSFADFISPRAKHNIFPNQSALEEHRTNISESILTHRNGSDVPVLATGVPLRRKGKTAGVIFVLTDLSERKTYEDELRRQKRYFETLFRHNPMATVTLNAEGLIQACNPAFNLLFGYQEKEVLGRELDPLIVEELEREKAKDYTRGAAEGAMMHDVVRRRRKDGTLVDVEMFAVPVIVKQERVSVLALYHDITDLMKARNDAEAAAKAKSEFLANMSHEIRTPLNAIIGMTSLLLDTPLNLEQRNFINTVRNSGDTLLSIINDILDFSKIEAGKMLLENQPFYLADCVESALDLVASKAAEKGLELAFVPQENLPMRWSGDVTRLRQVLVNLLSNAVKFTETGEVVVAVSAHHRQASHYDLQFSVRDTGIGISPEKANQLFSAFTQVDASTTRKYGGTGLGLAISKHLVGLMGGKIWVESEPGKGSTFHFTIHSESVPVTGRMGLNVAQPSLAGRRILVVDDNATNRLILTRQSQMWGMIPVEARSGAEALGILAQNPRFDVAILDMQMPEMDGITLAQSIQANPLTARLPLVMFTSLGKRPEDTAKAHFAAYLTKPIKFELLYETLSQIFGENAPVKKKSETRPLFDPQMGIQHPLKILLAEDNIINQKVATSILDRLGYRVDVAANGYEVLDALDRQGYDIILMDVQMPEMDGEETTHRIRTQMPPARQPRIIAMTANALEGDRERYLGLGMDDYISKPIRVEDLISALRESLPPTAGEQHERH